MANVKFNNSNALFSIALRKNIDAYFEEKNLKRTGNYKLYWKTTILLISLAVIYSILVFFTPDSVLINVILCILLGVNFSAIGFNVMHDGAHGSYSGRQWVNNLMAFSLNLLGGNSFIWKQKHNVNHHTFTNIEGMDDDIAVEPMMRVHLDQKKYWFHRYQQYYFLFLYGLTFIFWIFYQDFFKYFRHKVTDHSEMKKMDTKEHLAFWASKILHITVFLIIPFIFVGVAATLLGYLIMAFATGMLIAVVFQLAHVVEDLEFVAPENMDKISIENEWMIHQLNTTANFATRNKFVNWLMGGLNFQVEHHLFPKISHIHYPAINDIVMDTCREYQVGYNEFPTMISAIKSHIRLLRKMGIAD